MQPGQGTLDHPPSSPQAAAVRRPALGELGSNPSPPELVAVGLRIVSAVALDQLRLPRGSAGAPAQRRHRIDERNPVRVGENMMFRPGFAAIGRVRSSFSPAQRAERGAVDDGAGQIELAPAAQFGEQDRVQALPDPRPLPAQQARRQQVVPDPQPISRGSRFHGIPLRSTNRMPVSTARSGIGFRPAYRRLRRRRFGSNGSMRIHKSSSIKTLVMSDRLTVG